jgi:DTW domain-containing protein
VASAPPARSVCYRCFKPTATCVCGDIRQLANRTGITILQHPRERNHPIGTARFLQLGLSDVRLFEDTDSRLRTAESPVSLPPGAGVLYPSENARDLGSLPESERPKHLVVIDGTWHQAKTLYRDIPWLHDMPHYKFTPNAPSRYRIRREPREDYVSTLEATLEALALIEPDLGPVDDLLRAFDAMIDRQIEHAKHKTEQRVRTRRRVPAYRGLPRGIIEDYSRLVLIYAEGCSRSFLNSAPETLTGGSARFGLHDARREESELLYFGAYRIATGEHFEVLLAPSSGVWNERHLAHLGLTKKERERLSPEPDFAGFIERWRQFTRPEDVFAAWNQSALRWLDPPTEKRQHVLLKAAYGRLERCGGALEDIAAAEGFEALPLDFAGRARQRLGNALGLLHFLRRLAEVPE